MNTTARRAVIVKLLKKYNSVKTVELCKTLNVTRETVRRDLYYLEKQNIARTIRGGAILNVALNETNYERRLHHNVKIKQLIAEQFCKYVHKGDTVYLDYGTTSLAVAKILHTQSELTVITNSIPIINELYKTRGLNLIVLGGAVRQNEGSLYGLDAIQALRHLNINIGFFSGSGIDLAKGLSNHHIGESQLTRQALQQSQIKVVGVEHEKFNKVFTNHIMLIQDIDIVITDQLKDAALINALKQQTHLDQVNTMD